MKIMIAQHEHSNDMVTDASLKNVLFEIKRKASDAKKIVSTIINHKERVITLVFSDGSQESWGFLYHEI
jgi:light-regulated signal transduction histidine kinase (bacteriophytochrome)